MKEYAFFCVVTTKRSIKHWHGRRARMTGSSICESGEGEITILATWGRDWSTATYVFGFSVSKTQFNTA